MQTYKFKWIGLRFITTMFTLFNFYIVIDIINLFKFSFICF